MLLAFSVMEDADARVDEVNAWLAGVEQLPLGSVWECASAVGGSKRMEAPLYAGAFNGFDLPGFLAFVRTVAWTEPSEVQVMVHGQHDDRWRVIAA